MRVVVVEEDGLVPDFGDGGDFLQRRRNSGVADDRAALDLVANSKAVLRKNRAGSALGAGFLVNVALYFRNYHVPPHAQVAYTTDLIAIIHYVFAFIGSPFGFGAMVTPVAQATTIGVILLAALVAALGAFVHAAWFRRDSGEASDLLIWLIVAGFSLACAMMAAPTRAGLGIAQALSSRYITFALYLPLALLNITAIVTASRRPIHWQRGKLVIGVAAVVLVASQILGIAPAIRESRQTRADRIRLKASLLLIRSLPNDEPSLSAMYAAPDQLRFLAEWVNRYGFIRPPLIATNHARDIRMPRDSQYGRASYGRLETLTLKDADHLTAAGWAVFPRDARPADGVFLTWDRFDGDPIIFAVGNIGGKRTDVAGALGNFRFAACGWRATFPISRLPTGAGPLQVCAWCLNVQSGKAAPLAGAWSFDPSSGKIAAWPRDGNVQP